MASSSLFEAKTAPTKLVFWRFSAQSAVPPPCSTLIFLIKAFFYVFIDIKCTQVFQECEIEFLMTLPPCSKQC